MNQFLQSARWPEQTSCEVEDLPEFPEQLVENGNWEIELEWSKCMKPIFGLWSEFSCHRNLG